MLIHIKFKAQCNLDVVTETLRDAQSCYVFTAYTVNNNAAVAIFNKSQDPQLLTFDKKDVASITIDL